MISCNPGVCFGQPTLTGRRLTVYDIVTQIYYEDTVKAALDAYEITLQDAKDAVAYCMNVKCKEDESLINFCDGCILRTIHDGWDFKKEDYIETESDDGVKLTRSKDGKIFFLGSLSELEESEFGKVGWLMAEEVNKKLGID